MVKSPRSPFYLQPKPSNVDYSVIVGCESCDVAYSVLKKRHGPQPYHYGLLYFNLNLTFPNLRF